MGGSSSNSALRIIVLRGGALGDIILTLPVLRALRGFYPRCFITLAAPFPQAKLAHGEYADRVLDLNSATFVGLFDPAAAIADEIREDLTADLILSYLSDPAGIARNSLLGWHGRNTRFIEGPFKLDRERWPAVEQLAQPLHDLGIPLIDPIPRLTACLATPHVNRLAIHPGSGSLKKNWPLNRWAELLAILTPAFDEVLLISGEADAAAAEALRATIPANKLRPCANRPLWDLVSELSRGKLFIGHDSGVTHVAAATGIRTVALFGPTDPLIWSPNGDQVTVIQSPDQTMTGLSVETVLDALGVGPTNTNSLTNP